MAHSTRVDRNIAEAGATHINNVSINTNYSDDQIDRACLRALHCPDSLVVKNRLKENKDKLLPECFDWILRDKQYVCWKEGKKIGLLWIKGGAGKGKTMMSIGLIGELSEGPKNTTVVTYFFCQNADYELNTLEAIIKGLILQLLRQQESAKKSLRDRWDPKKEQFPEKFLSWRGLWDVFMEMLDQCACPQIYVVVDALDECRDGGMADLLRLIVRTGLDRPWKVKWVLTSRPLDCAEQELLTSLDQVGVSLELNLQHIAQAVRAYILHKVTEFGRRWRRDLGREIEEELALKAGDSFLWVSLVCKELEKVDSNKALATIQSLPSGLNEIYFRVLTELHRGEPAIVGDCVRLLKVMMMTYRPLHVREVSSVTGRLDHTGFIETLIDRSASLVKRQGMYLEFVHQSARDYLVSDEGRSLLDPHDQYGHSDIAMSCLDHLSRWLKVNLLDLRRPDTTTGEAMKEGGSELLASHGYSATFWAQHLAVAQDHTIIRGALAEDGEVKRFLHSKFLEWLECLTLIDQLPRAIESLRILTDALAKTGCSSLSAFVQDSTRFLQRHYQTLSSWPLQIYSSALVFSPKRSMVRRNNIDKIPCWLSKLPMVEEEWPSLIQTLAGHGESVESVAYSPDGRHIASGSDDSTIKIWDATTGAVEKTLVGLSDMVITVAYSPDGRHIASGSSDKTIEMWDVGKSSITSKWLGSTVSRHLKFRKHIKIETSESASILRFSADGTWLITDFDLIRIKKAAAGRQRQEVDIPKVLRACENWIFYGERPILVLPADFSVACYYTNGDQIVIRFENGRILTFTIDRRKLLSTSDFAHTPSEFSTLEI